MTQSKAAKYHILHVVCLHLDPEYKKFLENYNGDEEKLTSTPETLLEELEAKSKELVGQCYALFNEQAHLTRVHTFQIRFRAFRCVLT